MNDPGETTPDDDEPLVARPFEGFEREVPSPAPPRGSFFEACFSFSLSAVVGLFGLAALVPMGPRTGSTRSSHERRLERERAIAEAEAERDAAR